VASEPPEVGCGSMISRYTRELVVELKSFYKVYVENPLGIQQTDTKLTTAKPILQ
jgi:hypothetical protein